MTQYPDLFAALATIFEPQEVRIRSQAGRQLQYITARTAMNRLDDVLGPENWWDDYTPGENSVLCRLTIRLPDGSTITKTDAGGYAGMADSGDDDKSGFSDAFKRAAAKFGVARYLYRDGVPEFVRERNAVSGADAEAQPDEPPPARGGGGGGAPAPANGNGRRPSGGSGQAQAPANGNGHAQGNGNGRGGDSAPRSGRALFAWTKEQEQRHEVALLKYLNQWAKLQDFPGRMVDWDSNQVALAHAEAVRKLQSLDGPGDPYQEALAN